MIGTGYAVRRGHVADAPRKHRHPRAHARLIRIPYQIPKEKKRARQQRAPLIRAVYVPSSNEDGSLRTVARCAPPPRPSSNTRCRKPGD